MPRRGPEETAPAFELLGRVVEYAEQLQQQRTALRAVIRAIVVQRDDGRLCHVVGDGRLVPMDRNTERAVRGALAAARPAA